MSAALAASRGLAVPDIRDLERLLYLEALYLDRRDWDAWLDMFTEDGIYWMPLEADQRDPFSTLSLFHEDRRLMRMRIDRLRQPTAFSQQPPTRSVHLVSNVMLESFDAAAGACVVRSACQVTEYRLGRQRAFAALCRHDLRRAGDAWLIALKRVDLVNSEGPLEALQVFL